MGAKLIAPRCIADTTGRHLRPVGRRPGRDKCRLRGLHGTDHDHDEPPEALGPLGPLGPGGQLTQVVRREIECYKPDRLTASRRDFRR